jgi:drug/metabolite transporter (DMT)-like permease
MSQPPSAAAPPWWIWVVIVCATIGISFAGVLLQNELQDTPPISRACWRLSLTTLFLLPLAAWEFSSFWKLSDHRSKMFERKTWIILILSGLALCVHFAAWVWSLDLTSLAHSLLFVTTSPVMILIGNAILKTHRASYLEIGGVLTSVLGAGITLIDIREDAEVTAKGDALAFLGALSIVFHIACGRTLRSWMPTSVYALPVTFFAAIFLAIFAAIFDERTPVFGWSTSDKAGWFVLLAFVSGVIGHTGFNLALGYVSPIVVSISTTMEPVIGTFIGWLTYKTSPPGVFTSIGGPLLLAGIVCVVKAGEATNRRAVDDPSIVVVEQTGTDPELAPS